MGCSLSLVRRSYDLKFHYKRFNVKTRVSSGKLANEYLKAFKTKAYGAFLVELRSKI